MQIAGGWLNLPLRLFAKIDPSGEFWFPIEKIRERAGKPFKVASFPKRKKRCCASLYPFGLPSGLSNGLCKRSSGV